MAGQRVGAATTPSIAVILSVVTLMAAVGTQSAVAQSSCSSAVVSLSPCINYITGSDNAPSQSCCSALASVVKSNPACLCQLFTGSNNPLGSQFNQTRALAMPGECKVTTPPVSQCQGSGAPTTSPPATTGSSSPTKPSNPADSNPSDTNAGTGAFRSYVINVATGMALATILW